MLNRRNCGGVQCFSSLITACFLPNFPAPASPGRELREGDVMKASVAPQIEELRAEVQRLQDEVADLEARLTQDDPGQENVWAIWPYTWFVAGYQATLRTCRQTGDMVARWSLERHNRRTTRQHRMDSTSITPRLV